MLFITGDTHGTHDYHKLTSKNFPEGTKLTRNDYVAIMGDFGGVWGGDVIDRWLLNWYNTKPWTTLFVDGNHENHELLNSYPVEYWKGGKIHRIKENVIHLMRGQVFEIDGKKIFTFGGAMSTDKEHRQDRISWWREELPSYAEVNEALENLMVHDYEVDMIWTHTCPSKYAKVLYPERYLANDPTCRILDEFQDIVKYKAWYFGHMHKDVDINDDMFAVYNTAILVK